MMNRGYIIRDDGAIVCECHNRVVGRLDGGYIELWCKGSKNEHPHGVRLPAFRLAGCQPLG